MDVLELKILGRIPSKKNSKIWTGKRLIPNKAYFDWHKEATKQIESQYKGKTLELLDEVQIDFHMPDNRKTDLTNKAESIMDLLVDCGVIKDDCWQYIPRIYLGCRGVFKENPGVLIWLKYQK